jgi:flagellar protein FlaJ
MRKTRFFDKIQTFYNRLTVRLKLPCADILKNRSYKPQKKRRIEFENPQAMAYRLIGDKMGRLLPVFKDLDTNLQQSGLKANFTAYVSLTILVSALTCVAISIIILCLSFFALKIPLAAASLYSIGGGLFTFAFSTIGLYVYPIYLADAHRRALEDELPFTISYMAILTDAGVSPEKIFHSLAELNPPLSASVEARDVVRDVNLFGSDIISALKEESNRTPSSSFREFIEGLISTIHSGGNAGAYLRQKSEQYMKLKRINLKKFSDTLSMLSEFYVALLVTGPLLLVIMFTVMTMLGGGNIGIFSPDLLLNLLAYMGIPLGAIVFLIVLDAVSPKW